MKVTYKGMPHALPPKIQQKLDGKFAKLAKLLDGPAGRGERAAHVIVVQERHLHRAEVTLQFHDHELVGKGADTDLFTAIAMAVEKLDAQAVKQKARWRATHRRKNGAEARQEAPGKTPAGAASGGGKAAKRVTRVNGMGRNKPMTLDEALLEMDQHRDYLVYRDASRDKPGGGLSVLVRRRDGHFDLIES